MRVRHQHQVDWREIPDLHARLTQSLQQEQPWREVRIEQNILSAHLYEETGMADEREPEITVAGELGFAGFPRSWGDRRMPHQSGELACTLAQRGILERDFKHPDDRTRPTSLAD